MTTSLGGGAQRNASGSNVIKFSALPSRALLHSCGFITLDLARVCTNSYSHRNACGEHRHCCQQCHSASLPALPQRRNSAALRRLHRRVSRYQLRPVRPDGGGEHSSSAAQWQREARLWQEL